MALINAEEMYNRYVEDVIRRKKHNPYVKQILAFMFYFSCQTKEKTMQKEDFINFRQYYK